MSEEATIVTARELKRTIPRKAAAATGLMALLLAVGSALAFHLGTVAIELDGNVANGAGAGVDWATLFDASGNDAGGADPLGAAGNDIDRDFVVDFVAGASGPDPSYHEPSNKDNQPIFATGGSSVWGCRSVANPTDKDDILNAYAIAYTGQGEDADDLILSFGVERFDDSGTAYLGFWVFQKDVTCNLATNKFEGAKTDGDLLLLINFSNGGDNVTVNALAWHPGTPATSADGTFTTIGVGVGCDVAVEGVDNMCAITNGTGDQNVSTPWNTEDKTKPGAPNPDPVNVLEPPEFVEGAVNLTDAFAALPGSPAPPACFGSFMAETRSSDTLSATLKDFALGDLDTCDGSVSIAGTATNRVSTPHTFTVTATKSIGGGTVPATTGHVDVTLTGSDGIVAADIVVDAVASTCDNAGDNLDGAGQCTITFNSTETGKVTGHASVVIDLGGGSTLTRDTNPATATIGAGPGGSETPAVKTYVDATIDITGDGTNRVGVSHSFTATVKADSGNGSGFVAVNAQLVSIQKVDANGAVSVPAGTQTCTTNASGVCSVSFTSNSTGTTTGTASATVSVGGISFGINTTNDAATTGSEAVLKTWVDATIDITGDGSNRAGVNHSFTATLTSDDGDGSGPQPVASQLVSIQKVDANGAASVPSGTQTCTTNGSGVCSITFTSNSTGTTTGTASATVTVGGISFGINTTDDATVAANQAVLKAWVNARIGIVGDDTNSIEETHTFTVTLQKDPSASGGYIAANGEDVDVTLTDGGGAVHILDTTLTTCDVPADSHDGAGTDVNGQCLVVFTSNTAGTVTGSATSTLTVETVEMTVNTGDATSTTAATVLKTFVDGSVQWLKHDGDAQLLGGAEFEFCRTHRLDSSTDTYVEEAVPVCVTFIDNAAPDNDPADGQLEVIDLVLGRYTVEETTPPAGYHIKTPPGAGPFTFPDMTIEDPDVTLGTIFVNIRAFRIIVITCDDITHELVVSTVTFDSTEYDSMSAADLAAWNLATGQDLTEGEICGGDDQVSDPSLGGDASFGDLPAGTYDIRVKVPQAI